MLKLIFDLICCLTIILTSAACVMASLHPEETPYIRCFILLLTALIIQLLLRQPAIIRFIPEQACFFLMGFSISESVISVIFLLKTALCGHKGS